jgi:hypothetical protein
MTHAILSHNGENRHCGTVTQSIIINSPPSAVWKEISNFAGLTEWVVDVKKTEFLSKTKRGIGAVRKITFADGTEVVEYAVGWRDGEYLSYIATSGLPLDGYHATISVLQKGDTTNLRWTSFLISTGSDKKQFEEFLTFMESFYASSLKNLKIKLEKAT